MKIQSRTIAHAIVAFGILVAILMLGVMVGIGVSEQYYELRNAPLGIIFSLTVGDSYFDRSLRYGLISVLLPLIGFLGSSSTLVVRVFGLVFGALAMIQSYLLVISANRFVAGEAHFDFNLGMIFFYADFFLITIIFGLMLLQIWSAVRIDHQKISRNESRPA